MRLSYKESRKIEIVRRYIKHKLFMKKLTLFFIAVMATLVAYAQKDVTTFLGIPVDGSKPEMKKMLISKGFTPDRTPSGEDVFVGEFNGTDVHVHIVTNNNKVYRIAVFDANRVDEADIKIRFNNLVGQFERNKRYAVGSNQTIAEDEDISYEMTVHAKTYDAYFFQELNIELLDTLALQNEVQNELLGKYTMEQLQEPNEEVAKDIEDISRQKAIDILSKKLVWFRIMESYGKYYIAMFYDNGYNKVNGEDL